MIKINKILEFGFYILIFLLPVQTRLILSPAQLDGKYWEYGTISLYVSSLLLLALLFLLARQFLKAGKYQAVDKPFKINSFWWLVAGLDLIIFISIFIAPNASLALYRYIIFLLGVGILTLVVFAPLKQIKLFYFFLAGLLFQATLGLSQFVFQYAPAFKYLGLAEHDPKNLGVSVIEVIAGDGVGERWLRAYGGLDHPNILGGILAIGLIILTALIVNKYQVNKNQKALGYLVFALLLAGLFFTFSRGAILAWAVGMMVLLVGQVVKKQGKKIKATLSLLSLATLFFLVLAFSYQDLVKTRITGETRLELKSSQERVDSLAQGWEIIKQKPLLGVGLGNYTLFLAEQEMPTTWDYQPVHNSFLLIGAEVGLLGLLFFLSILIYLFFKSFQAGNSFNLSILSSLVIILMLDHWLWSLPFGIFFFWLMIGIIFKNLKLKIHVLPNQVKQ